MSHQNEIIQPSNFFNASSVDLLTCFSDGEGWESLGCFVEHTTSDSSYARDLPYGPVINDGSVGAEKCIGVCLRHG